MNSKASTAAIKSLSSERDFKRDAFSSRTPSALHSIPGASASNDAQFAAIEPCSDSLKHAPQFYYDPREPWVTEACF